MLPVNYDSERAVQVLALATTADEEEQALLACFLVDEHLARELAPRVRPQDLYRDPHRIVMEAIQRLVSKNQVLDLLALRDEIARQPGGLEAIGGYPFLVDLCSSIPTTAHVMYYFAKVAMTSVRRQLLRATNRINQIAVDLEIEDPAGAAIAVLLDIETPQDGTLRLLADVIQDQIARIESAYEAVRSGGKSPVVRSGFYDVDKMIVMGPKKLIIVAGRPAMGKSAWAFQTATHIATTDPVLYVTLEMGGEELAGRIISADVGISANQQATGFVRDEHWTELYAMLERYRDHQLYIEDPPAATIAHVESIARRLMARVGRKLGLVVVDYLGLLDAQGRDDTAKVSAISRGAKKMAQALDVPVMLLSQLSRAVENRDDKRPVLSDLRQSGSVEQDADIVLFLYRDEYYNPKTPNPGKAELLTRKNRGGPVGTVMLRFDGPTTRFADDEFEPPDYPAPYDPGARPPYEGPDGEFIPPEPTDFEELPPDER